MTGTTGDDMLLEIVRGAAKADMAEAVLRHIRDRLVSFTIEFPVTDLMEAYSDVAEEIRTKEAARRLGMMIMQHSRAVRRMDSDRGKRFRVTVLLDP